MITFYLLVYNEMSVVELNILYGKKTVYISRILRVNTCAL